jgi:hypothetical protein
MLPFILYPPFQKLAGCLVLGEMEKVWLQLAGGHIRCGHMADVRDVDELGV